MRILNIAFALATVSEASVGGAEQILARLDRELVGSGHESIVVAAEDSQVSGELFGTPPAPPDITRDYYSFRYAEHSRAISAALKSESVDLVHMHGFDFHEFIPRFEVPVLATLHLPPQWYPRWIYRTERPNFSLNCVSNSQRAEVPESELVARTIANGVEIPCFEPPPMSERSGAVILGRICPEKATHIGIAAARCAGVPLKIAGRAFGYPEHLKYFEEKIVSALDDAVLYLGTVGHAEKTELLRSAKCLLVPSVAPETSSLVTMEALACGTPVIAMRSGALPEIVNHGTTGFIVDNADTMADAIAHVDGLNPMICREVASRRFSAQRMARQYLELYADLIGRRGIPQIRDPRTLQSAARFL